MAKGLSTPGQNWLDQTLSYGQGATTPATGRVPTPRAGAGQWWQTPGGYGGQQQASAEGARQGGANAFMSLAQTEKPPVVAPPEVGTGKPTVVAPPEPGVFAPPTQSFPPTAVGGDGKVFSAMNGYDPVNARGTPGATPWWSSGQYQNSSLLPVARADLKPFYTPGVAGSHPQDYWQQVGALVSGGNQQFLDFWNANYGKVESQFWKAAEGDKTLQFPDFVTGKIAAQIWQAYQLLPPQQRGVDPRSYDPGRYNTSY